MHGSLRDGHTAMNNEAGNGQYPTCRTLWRSVNHDVGLGLHYHIKAPPSLSLFAALSGSSYVIPYWGRLALSCPRSKNLMATRCPFFLFFASWTKPKAPVCQFRKLFSRITLFITLTCDKHIILAVETFSPCHYIVKKSSQAVVTMHRASISNMKNVSGCAWQLYRASVYGLYVCINITNASQLKQRCNDMQIHTMRHTAFTWGKIPDLLILGMTCSIHHLLVIADMRSLLCLDQTFPTVKATLLESSRMDTTKIHTWDKRNQ